MARVLLLLLIMFPFTPSLASGQPLPMPGAFPSDTSPKPEEIKKIAKLLENPAEREKLLKTLQVLAAAREAQETRKEGSLVAYITPILDFSMDRAAIFFTELKKIPGGIEGMIDFFTVEKNRDDFWTALKRFPLLVVIGGILEGMVAWFFRRRLARKQLRMAENEVAKKKGAYAYLTLFYPFLYSLLFLPLLVSNPFIGNWMIGLWLTLFAVRIVLLERKMIHVPLSDSAPLTLLPKEEPKERLFLKILGSVFLFALVMSLLNVIFTIKSYGEDFILNLTLFLSFPLVVLYFREWKRKEMPSYLRDSRSLATAPLKIAPLINICIRYLPWLLLGASIPLIIDKAFLGKGLWQVYGAGILETFLVLGLFLKGRQSIDSLTHYQMPQIQAATSYLTPLQAPLARSIQWIWHLSFFGLLMGIWNNCFSSFFIGMVSYPLTKTVAIIGLIWGIIYLLWLGLDSFVQFHTKPQWVKGKRREPTIFAKTFGPMLHSVARWVMVLGAIFVMLESFGVDLKILVYMVSAFALAVSLGAQSLVKDVINGFFALVDASFAVGEVITVGTHTGTVESLSLRAVTLRHKDGSLQTIPFSEVGNIINRSRDYTLVPISVATSYKTKIGLVYDALNQTAEEMATDAVFGKMILDSLKISGIERFAENAVYVSASIKVKPDPRETFLREFNRRLKAHLDALKIAPPIAFQEEWT